MVRCINSQEFNQNLMNGVGSITGWHTVWTNKGRQWQMRQLTTKRKKSILELPIHSLVNWIISFCGTSTTHTNRVAAFFLFCCCCWTLSPVLLSSPSLSSCLSSSHHSRPPSGCSHSCIHPASCLAVILFLDSDTITPVCLSDQCSDPG